MESNPQQDFGAEPTASTLRKGEGREGIENSPGRAIESERFEKTFSLENAGFKPFRLDEDIKIAWFLDAVRWDGLSRNFEKRHRSDRSEHAQRFFEKTPLAENVGKYEFATTHDLENIKTKIPEGTCLYAFGDYREGGFYTKAPFTREELRMTQHEMHTVWMHGMAGATAKDEEQSFDKLHLQIEWREYVLPYLDSEGISDMKWIQRYNLRQVSGEKRDDLPQARIVQKYEQTRHGPFHLVGPGDRIPGKPTGLHLDGNWGMFDIVEGKSKHGEELTEKGEEEKLPYDRDYDLTIRAGNYVLFKEKTERN